MSELNWEPEVGRLRSLGEFGLIDRVRRVLRAPEVDMAGIGDDCAVLRVGDRVLLATCDAAVEDVHFSQAWATPEDIGWKCAAAAISDIAAMGGRPLFVLSTLACPPMADPDFVERLYQGMQSAVAHCATGIVGGDTVRSNQGFVVDITVIGEPMPHGRYLLRSGAQAGDVLAVTGWPGRSGAGLAALQQGVEAPEAVAAHLHPLPRLAAGQWLAELAAAHALIDVSDGLAQDAGHLAADSGVGLDLWPEALPIGTGLREAAEALGLSPEPFVLGGGEDYELAVALEAGEAAALCAAFEAALGLPLTVVGRFGAGAGVTVGGEPLPLGGFDHFGG